MTSSTDGMIYFSDYVREEVVAKYRKTDGKIYAMAFSHESRVLYMGSENDNILKINFDELLTESKSGHRVKMKSEKALSSKSKV